MRGLDTNVLVRFLTQDDPEQARRVDRLIADAQRRGDVLYVSAIVLCETVWVLRSAYGHDRGNIAEALDRMLSAPELVVESSDLARDALAEYRDGSGDFSDCFIGRRNVNAGCDTTATFDKRLSDADTFTLV
jgi:predicted nucleic-acid-binding protein